MEYFVIKSNAAYLNGSTWVDSIELAEVYQVGKIPWIDGDFEVLPVTLTNAYSTCFCPFCGARVLHAKKIEL